MALRLTKNLVRGAGKAFDIMPRKRSYRVGKIILGFSNSEAIHRDWGRVGGEIQGAFRQAKAKLAAHGQQKQRP